MGRIRNLGGSALCPIWVKTKKKASFGSELGRNVDGKLGVNR